MLVRRETKVHLDVLEELAPQEKKVSTISGPSENGRRAQQVEGWCGMWGEGVGDGDGAGRQMEKHVPSFLSVGSKEQTASWECI